MTTELLLSTGTETWDDVAAALTDAIQGLVEHGTRRVVLALPQTGQRIDVHRLADGSLRLAATGNDTLVGESRLTVRDERAVIAVGFSVASASWGTFYWDWTSPVNPALVASGMIRTVRDIYKASPSDLELSVTL